MKLENYTIAEIDFDLEDGFLSFELVNGSECVLCSTHGEKVEEEFLCCDQGQSIEYARCYNFEYLIVDGKNIEVVESSIDVQDLELTEAQLKQLNRLLLENAVGV